MDDLVSKKVLIKAIENIESKYGNDNSSLIEQGEVLDLITEAPTVDAVPVVHGYWIDKASGSYGRWQTFCSVCGKHSGIGGILSNRHKSYCPNCGAKMVVGRNTE